MEKASPGVQISSKRYISVDPHWLKEAGTKMAAEAPDAIKNKRKLTVHLSDDLVLFFDPETAVAAVGGMTHEEARKRG